MYYFLYGCSQFYDNLSDGVKTKIRADSSDWCIVSLGETSSSDSSFIFVLGRVLREVSPCICQSADAPLAQAQNLICVQSLFSVKQLTPDPSLAIASFSLFKPSLHSFAHEAFHEITKYMWVRHMECDIPICNILCAHSIF